tara:strand:+ start:439 stop:867 length:429 start_codon:yes stop_codon:yes gene_type:complete
MSIKKITESAGGIVLGPNKKIILVNQNHDSWSLPKGHIDPGENSLEAAKREIYEESGVKELKLLKKIGFYERYKIGLDGKDDHTELKRIHLFLFSTKEIELQPIDPMNPEAKWCNLDEAISLLTHQEDRNYLLLKAHLFTDK